MTSIRKVVVSTTLLSSLVLFPVFTQSSRSSGREGPARTRSLRADPKSATLAGIKAYLAQMDGTCFKSGGFSIGDYDKFAAALDRNLKGIVGGKEGTAWLAEHSPSANSSHFAPWFGYGDAYIYFKFDPEKAATMISRQTMRHEATHHIEWLNGVKQPSKIEDPSTGKEVDNPVSERNTEYQDKVTDALLRWFPHDIKLSKQEVPLGTAISAWKEVEKALKKGENGDYAKGFKHDWNLKELTGFNAEYEDLVNYYKSGRCGEDARTLMYLVEVVPQLDWDLDVNWPDEMTLGDEASITARPFDSVEKGFEVVFDKKLNARFRWSVPRREAVYGKTLKFTPTEAISYRVKVDLVVPFMGKDQPIAHAEREITVKPKATPTPSPSPGEIDTSTVEFAGSVPGVWDGGNGKQAFNFKRQKASVRAAGECNWEGTVNAEVWGRLDDYRSPSEDEIDRKIADLTAYNKAWGKTTTVSDLNISGFKGKIAHSSVAWYRGSWSDGGFKAESVSAEGRGWAFKGKHVVEVGYNAGGGGCWNNSLKDILTAQTTAAQSEAKGIIASLTIVEKGGWVKIPYTGPPLTGTAAGPTPAPTPKATPKATPKPTQKATPRPTPKPPPAPSPRGTPRRTPSSADETIVGWYKHRSGDLQFPLFTGWTWQPNEDNKDLDMIISPDGTIGIFVKESVSQVAPGNEDKALQTAAASVAKNYKGASAQPTTVGGAKALVLAAYDPKDRQPMWFYFVANAGRIYYFWVMMAPDTGNVRVPAIITHLLDRVEFLGLPANGAPPAGEAKRFFDNGNIYGVLNTPTQPTVFRVSTAFMITAVVTYHWNDAAGTARPGTIALRSSTGQTYGPWRTSGTPGQGGVKNAYWTAKPNIIVPPGTYTIIDSDPSTWAQNSSSGGSGHAWVEGYPSQRSPSVSQATPKPPPAAATQPTSGSFVTAVFENRSAEPAHIFVEGETFGPGNKIAPGEKRQVRVKMPASGRIKFVCGRSGQVIATRNWDGDPDSTNRYPVVKFDGTKLLITTGLR